MPKGKMKIDDYFYEFAGTPKNKIITREMYQDIALKMALHSVAEHYVKTKKMIGESQLETYITMNDMQCQLAAEKKPEIYDLRNSEINNSGFAPKPGTVSASESAKMVNAGIRSMINYAVSEEGLKQAIKNEYALYLKSNDETYAELFNQLSNEEKSEIETDHFAKMGEQGFTKKSPDEIMSSIKFISEHKAEYDSLSRGTRFMAFFGFGKAADLRKAVYGNMSKLESYMDKTILNETLANPTENNLVASANSYLAGAKRKDEAVVVNRLVESKDPLTADEYVAISEKADEIEDEAMEKHPTKARVEFVDKEFDEEDELEPFPDDESVLDSEEEIGREEMSFFDE